MNIQADKLDLIEWISKLEDDSIVDKLLGIRSDYLKSKDWWDILKQDEIESINRGLQDFEVGNTHSHNEARMVYEKYL